MSATEPEGRFTRGSQKLDPATESPSGSTESPSYTLRRRASVNYKYTLPRYDQNSFLPSYSPKGKNPIKTHESASPAVTASDIDTPSRRGRKAGLVEIEENVADHSSPSTPRGRKSIKLPKTIVGEPIITDTPSKRGRKPRVNIEENVADHSSPSTPRGRKSIKLSKMIVGEPTITATPSKRGRKAGFVDIEENVVDYSSPSTPRGRKSIKLPKTIVGEAVSTDTPSKRLPKANGLADVEETVEIHSTKRKGVLKLDDQTTEHVPFEAVATELFKSKQMGTPQRALVSTPNQGSETSTGRVNVKTPRSNARLGKPTPVARKLEDSMNEIASPSGRPKRGKNVVKPNYEEYFECDSSSDSDHECASSSDSDEENYHTSDEDEDVTRSKDAHNKISPNKCTPSKHFRLEMPALNLTPKVMKCISKNINAEFSPRRTPDIKNVKNTPKSESYFTADTRIKFSTPQRIRKDEMKKNKETKGKQNQKKPRKGNRQGIDKISSKQLPVAPNFSVTKEIAKLPSDIEFEIPWIENHLEAIEALHQEITMDFPRWWILLREGFNIMLHGYGSKKPIFDQFSQYLEDKYLVIVINGLFTKFNARKFVLDFVASLDFDREFDLCKTSIYSMTEDLYKKVKHEKNHPPVFIFASNFDMLAARHKQLLTALSGLSRLPFVHLIGSSDHINAGLGILPAVNLRLNFVWVDCTTFINYTDELQWNPNAFGNASDALVAENSITHIFKSLTTNAKKTFGILAALQLQKLRVKSKSKSIPGVEFRELFRRCREGFIVHSELGLKALLTEFVDHKLVRYIGKGKNDDNFLAVDLEQSVLEKYAENL